MNTLYKALEEYGNGEGLEMQDIPKRLLDNFAIKLFTDTSLAGDKGKQDEILDTMINQRQTIQMQYDMGLIDDDFMLELAEIWNNIHDPILDYERQEIPQMQGTWDLLDNI
jgi:hypothetical protein